MPRNESNLAFWSLIIALIGCITGIISLSWQGFTYYQDSRENVAVKYSSRPDIIKKVLTPRVEITNQGKRDLYIKEVKFNTLASDSSNPLTYEVFTSKQPNDTPIPPGGFRLYDMKQLSYDDARNLLYQHRNNLNIIAVSSRDKAYKIDDIDSDLNLACMVLDYATRK